MDFAPAWHQLAGNLHQLPQSTLLMGALIAMLVGVLGSLLGMLVGFALTFVFFAVGAMGTTRSGTVERLAK